MKQGMNRKMRFLIVILSVLLVFSIAALCGVLFFNNYNSSSDITVSVKDNVITPDKKLSKISTRFLALNKAYPNSAPQVTETNGILSLNSDIPSVNVPFYAVNMFPGDEIKQNYSVEISHKDKISLNFSAVPRSKSDKLSEALKIRIYLPESNELLYDGAMSDMPDSVTHTVNAANSSLSRINYEITAYLDTSVGNEYQNLQMIADFKWWAAESENLGPAPQTGIIFNVTAIAVAVLIALSVIILLLRKRRKGENNGYK